MAVSKESPNNGNAVGQLKKFIDDRIDDRQKTITKLTIPLPTEEVPDHVLAIREQEASKYRIALEELKYIEGLVKILFP